jgi:probable HAF family extracellular repeat protein
MSNWTVAISTCFLFAMDAYGQSSPQESLPKYQVMFLGPRTQVQATAINNRGQIVGSMAVNGTPHAFLWEDGTFTDLGLAGSAVDISNNGAIVGNYCAGGVCQGFLLQKKRLTGLGTFSPSGVNSRLQIAGNAPASDGQIHAFLWQKGAARDLGTLSGTNSSRANGINEAGQIVGVAISPLNFASRVFLYDHNVMRDLSILGNASSINNRGEIAGFLLPPTLMYEAFSWDNGTTTHLPGSGQFITANALNDEGQIVGQSATPNTKNALTWIDSQLYFLNSMVDRTAYPTLTVTNAYAINSQGAILALGCNTPSCTRAGADSFSDQLLLLPIEDAQIAP